MSEKTINSEGIEKKNSKILGIAFFSIFTIVVIFVIVASFSGKKKSKNKENETQIDFNEKVSQLAQPSLPNTYNHKSINDGNSMNPNDINQLVLQQLAEMKQEQELIKEQISKKQNTPIVSGGGGAGPVGYHAPHEFRKRLDPEYRSIVQHFQGTDHIWEMEPTRYSETMNQASDRIANVENELKELYSGAQKISSNMSGLNIKIPAGTRLQCITEHPINSDYTGYFTAIVRRPDALYGCQLIGEINAQQNNRIPTRAIAIVTKKGNRIELAENQVEMEFPGMTGNVTNHYLQRVIPSIASAAVGGRAALYLLNSQTPGANETQAGNISTRDLVAGPIIEQSVQGIQNEINRLSVDKPNTVEVRKGTVFNVLLVQNLEITL